MAEYLAVDYNGIYNRFKQNTDYIEAPVEVEAIYSLAEDGSTLIDKLNFNTLESDINKPNEPLNFKTKYTPTEISTFKAENRQLIKVDKYGNHSAFGVTSNASYNSATNMWNINSTNNVSFNDEQLINGGAFTIMFLYHRYSKNENEELVCFSNDPSVISSDDIIFKRNNTYNSLVVL